VTSRQKIVLFFVILVIPALVGAVTASISFSRAQSVEFCASCHTMTPWIDDVTGKESDSLAHDHFERRWIQHDQCYTCHSNYGFLGPIEAKIKGMRHVVAFYIGEHGHIDLYGEFPNGNCLKCHADAKGFLEDSNHEPIEDLLSGKDKCVECHENLHNVEQEGDDVAEEAADAADSGDADESGDDGDADDSGDGNGGADEKDGGKATGAGEGGE
jgi:cytochrome c-type protein NapC